MRTFGSFTWALLLSLILSQVVAQQLAIYFGAREEFIAVMALLMLFALISIVVFAIVFAVSDGQAPLNRTALALVGVAVASVLAVMLFDVASNGFRQFDRAELQIFTEILFPALIVVLIQWWRVRRRRAVISKSSQG